MFYTTKDKQFIAALHHKIEVLSMDIKKLRHYLDIQTTRLDALMKAYPHGTTRTGEPRKKPGRKPKEQA